MRILGRPITTFTLTGLLLALSLSNPPDVTAQQCWLNVHFEVLDVFGEGPYHDCDVCYGDSGCISWVCSDGMGVNCPAPE
jgi:hypothetical protein